MPVGGEFKLFLWWTQTESIHRFCYDIDRMREYTRVVCRTNTYSHLSVVRSLTTTHRHPRHRPVYSLAQINPGPHVSSASDPAHTTLTRMYRRYIQATVVNVNRGGLGFEAGYFLQVKEMASGATLLAT